MSHIHEVLISMTFCIAHMHMSFCMRKCIPAIISFCTRTLICMIIIVLICIWKKYVCVKNVHVDIYTFLHHNIYIPNMRHHYGCDSSPEERTHP